jgi:hypothetical protein
MTDPNSHHPADLAELNSRYLEKKLAFETAISVHKPHSEINQLYQELKTIQQELNLALLQEELKKETES